MKAFCSKLFLLVKVWRIVKKGKSLTDFTAYLCWKMHSHCTQNWSDEAIKECRKSLQTLQCSFLITSKTSNKILGKCKWFCTNQISTQICHTPIFLLAKDRNLENQVRKEQNYPAAVTAAHKNKWKCNSSLFLFNLHSRSRRTHKMQWRLTYVISRWFWWFFSCILISDQS